MVDPVPIKGKPAASAFTGVEAFPLDVNGAARYGTAEQMRELIAKFYTSGEGTPVGLVDAPAGTLYLDTDEPAVLYFNILGGIDGWVCVCGVPSAVIPGFYLRPGPGGNLTIICPSPSGQLILTDQIGDAGFGNCLAFNGASGRDGTQSVSAQLGSTGQFPWTLGEDGESHFPGPVHVARRPAQRAQLLPDTQVPLPFVVSAGVNDEFVFTPIATGIPDTFTVAPGTYSTLDEITTAMLEALDGGSTAFTSFYLSLSSADYVAFRSVGTGAAHNGDTLTSGTHDILAGLGFTSPVVSVGATDAATEALDLAGDAVFSANTQGPVIADQADGHTYRIVCTNGVLSTQLVT